MTIGTLIEKYNQDVTANSVISSETFKKDYTDNENERERLINERTILGEKANNITKKSKALSLVSIILIAIASASLFFSMFIGLIIIAFAAGIFITSVNVSKEIKEINSQIKLISEKVINLTNENGKIKAKQNKTYKTYDLSGIKASITSSVLDMQILDEEAATLNDILVSEKANAEGLVYAFVRKDLANLSELSLYLKMGDEVRLPNLNKANETLKFFLEDAATYFTGSWGLYNDNGRNSLNDVTTIVSNSNVEMSQESSTEGFEINKAA